MVSRALQGLLALPRSVSDLVWETDLNLSPLGVPDHRLTLFHVVCPKDQSWDPFFLICIWYHLGALSIAMGYHFIVMLMKQLYLKLGSSVSNTSFSYFSSLPVCLEEIKILMQQNFLQLNSSKTEVIHTGTSHQIQQNTFLSITFFDQNIPLSNTIIKLGLIFDPQLTIESHTKHICKISFFHLWNIAKLWSIISLTDAEKLVDAFVSLRLDYCNAVLIRTPVKNIRKQHVQNSSARILMRVHTFEHITPVHHSLHWLPVSARINYKILLLTFHRLYGKASSYLLDLITLHCPSHTLHFSNTNLLHILKTCTRTIGDGIFHVLLLGCGSPSLLIWGFHKPWRASKLA